MIFITGPRQVGKTTLSKSCAEGYPYIYLNWDNLEHREQILAGISVIYDKLTTTLQDQTKTPIIIFDEIHKFRNWKNLLKGYFDTIESRCKVIVTGSAKLNVYRRGGDSMMGRYFLYRIHPLTVAEIVDKHQQFTNEINPPQKITSTKWNNLLNYGGFPEPYLEANPLFYQRWINLKHEQFFREDLRDLSKIFDLSRLELLANLLIRQIGSTTKYSELAKKVQVSEPTIRNWISTLQNLYYCYAISPWSKNISRSLLKEPKIYLWDWSVIPEQGAKIENLVASHLYKAVNFWTDLGLGKYDLFYLRDKDKHEVDFLVTKNKNPWLMVEVKTSSNGRVSENLHHFNKQLKVPHVFEVVANLDYVDQDCFAAKKPTIVPLITFLSQLV